MEKGANSRSGFRVSDKKSSSNSDFDKWMKFDISTTMMGENLDRPSAGDYAGGGGGGVGPTKNGGGANEAVGNIYFDNISSAQNFAKSSNLQRLDIFSSSYSTIPCKSPEMAGNMGFAFTYDQRKEMERQAMIYKHMISSVPVPPHLLFPFSRNSTASSIFDAKYSKNGDPEPGRCKRTDGKKWRCSRETAPHQKYCERHLHRGRPRSRKPVEVKNNDDNHKKTCRDHSKSVPAVTVSQQIGAANAPLLSFNAEADPSVSTASHKRDHRDLGLTLEGQMEHLMEAKMGLSNEAFSMQHQQQPLTFFPNSNFPTPEIGFIDAWSIDNMNTTDNTNVESWRSLNKSDLSTSLDLSMAQNFEVGHIQMKNNVEDYDHEHKTNDSMLLGPVSWEPFGGPLGEALQSGSLAFGSSSLDSPYSSISTPATTISSPSRVLHRTLFSDGSVCNSPSFGGFDF